MASTLALKMRLSSAYIGAAYSSLLVTTVTSKRLFTADGPPTFDIKPLIAFAADTAAAAADCRWTVNVNFESSLTLR